MFEDLSGRMCLKPLAAFVQGEWNWQNRVPMHQWLIEECGEDHDERMRILGNVVVPACAELGFDITAMMATSRVD